MINWIKRKLGIIALENTAAFQTAAIHRIEKKIRIGRKPQRYDEIERARKRRYKKA